MLFLIPVVLTIILLIVFIARNETEIFKKTAIFFAVSIIGVLIIRAIDIDAKTTDREVWSGEIIDVCQTEEYDETVTYTTTDKDGKTHTSTRIEHHMADNYIETSDNGKVYVNKSLDGKIRFNDDFPNTDKELQKFYPIGMPTASVHSYENKVKNSYSIYKSNDIALNDFPGLPDYPLESENEIQIDRFLGPIKNKDVVIERINSINSFLNNKNNKKQVNLIVVNFQDKPFEYGQALQDHWEGGNKNDFVIVLGSKDDIVTWCYPFSWADDEESEKLKIVIRDYLKDSSLDNLPKSLDFVENNINQSFTRKQFADFDYIEVDISIAAYIIALILNGAFAIIYARNINEYVY